MTKPDKLTIARAAVLAAGVVLCVVCVGCATVAPYERERLAKPDMALAGNGDANAGADHATAYREGSSGALGASGGGCGCN